MTRCCQGQQAVLSGPKRKGWHIGAHSSVTTAANHQHNHLAQQQPTCRLFGWSAACTVCVYARIQPHSRQHLLLAGWALGCRCCCQLLTAWYAEAG